MQFQRSNASLLILLLLHSQCCEGFQLPIWNNNPASIRNSRASSPTSSTQLGILGRKKTEDKAETDDKATNKDISTRPENEGSSVTGYRVRSRVKELAKRLVTKPLSLASDTIPMPQAIASVLKDASLAAIEEVEDIMERNERLNGEQALDESKKLITTIIDDAFVPMEESLDEMEAALTHARESLKMAKKESFQAVEAIQVAAIAQAEGAATAVAQAEKLAEDQVMEQIVSSAMADIDVSDLSFDDVNYDESEMAPPFLDPDSCLVPGEPIVRVEKAPENSRRISAGIDIMASVDDVWNVRITYYTPFFFIVSLLPVQNTQNSSSLFFKVLTNYDNLQNVSTTDCNSKVSSSYLLQQKNSPSLSLILSVKRSFQI